MTIENRGSAGAEVPVLVQTANGEKSVPCTGEGARQGDRPCRSAGRCPTRVMVNDGSVPEADTSNNVYTIETKPQP